VEKVSRATVPSCENRGRGDHPRPALFRRRRGAPPLAALCLLALAFTPAGGPWVRQRSGTLAWLHGVHFVDERRGWAAGGKGALLSTDDGGATWRAMPAPSEDSLRDVYFADEANGWLVCERGLHALGDEAEPRSYLLRTADGGRTWSRVSPAAGGAEGRLVGLRFADAAHGWAYGELGALYATRDGGDTWARQAVPTRRLLLAAEFFDARRGWLAGAGGTLLRTEDGGATWREGLVVGGREAGGPAAARRPATGPRFNAVEFADERRGWAVGSRGALYATEDGGRTWRAQNSGVAADLLDVKFADARTGWAVGSGGLVLRTRDGGRTWQAEAPVTPHALERLSLVGSTRLWAVGFGGTIVALKD